MKYRGLILKSRTLDWSVILAVFGVIEMNLPMVKDQIGEHYGWIFIGVAAITAALRAISIGPVGEKPE